MASTTRALLAVIMVASLPVSPLAQTLALPDLASATLEELLAIVVTTASRAREGLAAAPARMQVVSAAQIERRGYRLLLDVLKDIADFKVELAGDPESGFWNLFSNMEKSFKCAYGSMSKVRQQFAWKPTPSIVMTTGVWD